MDRVERTNGRPESDDITASHHGGNRYSEEANEHVSPHKATQRYLVLRMVAEYSPYGISSDGVEAITGMPHQTCGARFTELKADGLIYKVGTGLTRQGCKCALYAARPELVAALKEAEKEKKEKENGRTR